MCIQERIPLQAHSAQTELTLREICIYWVSYWIRGCGDCWLPKRFKLADEEGEEPGYGGAQDISEITTVTAVSGSLSLMHASISSQRLCNAL